jgi:hypothetical protein
MVSCSAPQLPAWPSYRTLLNLRHWHLAWRAQLSRRAWSKRRKLSWLRPVAAAAGSCEGDVACAAGADDSSSHSVRVTAFTTALGAIGHTGCAPARRSQSTLRWKRPRSRSRCVRCCSGSFRGKVISRCPLRAHRAILLGRRRHRLDGVPGGVVAVFDPARRIALALARRFERVDNTLGKWLAAGLSLLVVAILFGFVMLGACERLAHVLIAITIPQRQLSWPVSDNYLGR